MQCSCNTQAVSSSPKATCHPETQKLKGREKGHTPSSDSQGAITNKLRRISERFPFQQAVSSRKVFIRSINQVLDCPILNPVRSKLNMMLSIVLPAICLSTAEVHI